MSKKCPPFPKNVHQKINKKIKEEIEVDNVLLKRIDINMKNAINKILHDYKLQQ